jgi:hypothetical protein
MLDKNDLPTPCPISTLKIEIFDENETYLQNIFRLETDGKYDGFVVVEFIPEMVGKYKLVCHYKDEKISEEPFTFECHPTTKYLDSDFGIIYNFGTNHKSTGFVNPILENLMEVEVSSTFIGKSSSISDLLKISNFTTKDEKGSFIKIKFLKCEIMPTKYSFKHGNEIGFNVLRSWVLEGSKDEENWVVLKEHIHDYTLPTQKSTTKGEWDIEPTGEFFSSFRIRITGRNAAGNYHLSMCGIEFFGYSIDK